MVLAWGLVQLAMARPSSICADGQGWRQVDTQTIARNFVSPDARIPFPRNAWGGDGPGYVEAEFQIYPALIARILAVVGDVEWPGQVLSLAAACLTAL